MEKMLFGEKEFKELEEVIVKTRKYRIEAEPLEDFIKCFFQFMGKSLGDNVDENLIYGLRYKDYMTATVSYREGSGESIGNFGIGLYTLDEFNKVFDKNITCEVQADEIEKIGEDFFKGLQNYIAKKHQYFIENEIAQEAIESLFKHIIDILKEHKDEPEFEIEIKEHITFKLVNNGEQMGISITAGSEMKSKIKDDEKLEDMLEDDDDDDDDFLDDEDDD